MQYSVSKKLSGLEELNAFPHGWDADFRATSVACGAVGLHHIQGEKLLASSVELPSATIQRGATPAGTRTFALLMGVGPDIFWQGCTVSRRDLMVFNPQGDLHAVSRPGTSICTVSINKSTINHFLGSQGCSEDPLPEESQVLKVGDHFNRALLASLSKLYHCLAGADNSQVPVQKGLFLEQQLVDSLLVQVLSVQRAGERVTPHRRATIARKALQYIRANERNLLRVSQICEALGVSQRTLEIGFKEQLGISPKRFVNAVRLAGCHRDLLAADPACLSVQRVASEWGFWHMSQFARDYRCIYGALPSETLARPAHPRSIVK